MLEYLLLLVGLVRAALRSRSDPVAENLIPRKQLAILTRPTREPPRLRVRDRLFCIVARAVRRDWRRHLVVVRPEMVVGWHRQGWRRFGRWKSHHCGGRPRLYAEVRELTATIARENLEWGADRIRGELLKLRIAVGKRSVQQYRGWGPVRPPSQSWGTFLANHRPHLRAADLFTIRTLTFKTLYVLVSIAHGLRELVHWNATAHPTAVWVWRQLLAATPWGRQPRHLLRDWNAVYGGDFSERARRLGVETILTPVRALRANAVAGRVIGTLCWECLDRLIVVNEWHLRAILAEFVRFYNAERLHRTLRLQTPLPVTRPSVGLSIPTNAPHERGRRFPPRQPWNSRRRGASLGVPLRRTMGRTGGA